MEKLPFDIDIALDRIEEAVPPWPKAALFQLAPGGVTLGYVKASTPEKTLTALETTLPQRYWIDINRLLVPFGKHICTGNRPRCSTCPVLDMSQQIGVTDHR